MATQRQISNSGYACQFIDKVPEDYRCNQCSYAAREPNITTCCGECYCKACIRECIESKGPCPSCQENDYSVVFHARYQRNIQGLNVYCTMRDRGCKWTGECKKLDLHIDVNTGDCEYIDVQCTNDCNQRVQRRNLRTHLTNECPNREYTCPYCNYGNTFRVVSEHWGVCAQYPIPCPNRCGVTCERQVMEDHTNVCPLEEVQCELSSTGCDTRFQRQDLAAHMEQNTQKHITLLAAANLKLNLKLKEQEDVISKRHRDCELKQREFEDAHRQKDAQIKALEAELHTKCQELELHQCTLNLVRSEVGLLPYDVTFEDFRNEKARNGFRDSQAMYTHNGGYKFQIRVWANGLETYRGTHISVDIYSLQGVHDDDLIFPAKVTITLQLLNQCRDEDHYLSNLWCIVTKNDVDSGMGIGGSWGFISHSELECDSHGRIQYRKDDCLRFRITSISVQCYRC